LTINLSTLSIPYEEEHWPPPPVAKDIPLPQTALNKPLPSIPTADPVPDLMEELTACLRSLGRTSHLPSCPLTPEYLEPDEDSVVASDHQKARDTDKQPRYPHIPPCVSMQHRKENDEDPHNPKQEKAYRGPKPIIPDFSKGDPQEFARLKTSLDIILPEDASSDSRLLYKIKETLFRHHGFPCRAVWTMPPVSSASFC